MPLRSSYPEGPAFRLTEAEAKEALQSAATRGEVVGIYRSRTDGVLDLDHQDELLLRLLDGPHFPILVIRQRKDVPGEGRLVVWGGADGASMVGPTFPIKEWLEGTWEPKEPASVSPVEYARRPRSLRIAPIAAGLAAIVLLAPFLAWRLQIWKADSIRQEAREPRLVVQSVPSRQTPSNDQSSQGAAPRLAHIPEHSASAAAVEPMTRSRAAESSVVRSETEPS